MAELMGRFRPAVTGLFGKLPANGDFVRAELPEDFVAPWDGWCRAMMAASREALGEGWTEAWMEGPIWHFLLPPGCCGAQAVLGVWLPSMDKVGRHFPLVLGALASAASDLAAGAAWLEAAEAAGLAGIAEDVPHAELASRLRVPFADRPTPEDGAAMWWTQGGPFVQAKQIFVTGLLPAALAGAMLRDPVSTERF
jgi:type VI secretion system protein ImpM